MAKYLDMFWEPNFTGPTKQARRGGKYYPYCPDPLMARTIMFDGEVATAVSRAESAITKLNQTGSALTNTETLARLILRAEAVASSRIEGLEVGPRKLLQEELLQKTIKKDQGHSNAAAVIANINAMTFAIQTVENEALISTDLLCDIHAKLACGTQFEQYGGQLRTVQNWVGGNSYNPCNADYVPPTPESIDELMDDLAAFCNSTHLSPIIQAALAHAQFEIIHPFVDGNGRVGRALVHIILKKRGLAPNIIPPISLILATNAERYIQHLNGFRYEGLPDSPQAIEGMGEWVEFFASCSERAAVDTQGFENRIKQIQSQWRETLHPRKHSATDLLINTIPGMPIVSVASASKTIERSDEAVRGAIDSLVAAGILKQTTVGKRNRVFEAPDIISEFTSFERSLATISGDTKSENPKRPVPRKPV